MKIEVKIQFKFLFFLFAFLVCFVNCTKAVYKNEVINLSANYLKNHALESHRAYCIRKKIDLNGKTLNIPEQCSLVYEKGFFYNGEIKLNNTLLKGNIKFCCKTTGKVLNDTIKVDWFKYKGCVLADVFAMSQNKNILFGENKRYLIDYVLLIPTCKILGNGSIIEWACSSGIIDKKSLEKIKNEHYDGGGVDSISIENLISRSQADYVFLFNLQNTRNCIIRNCSFTCRGNGLLCSHAVDLRGNNYNTVFENCTFANEADAKVGGGLWIRSFGVIKDVTIKECGFYNNSTDEVFALNATVCDISNVQIIDSHFTYRKGKECPEPQVMWGMTYDKGMINNFSIKNSKLVSNFIPAYVLNIGKAENVIVEGCSFEFKDALLNGYGINTTAFNGKVDFIKNRVVINNITHQNEMTTLTLFHPYAAVSESLIENNCSKVFLGGPKMFKTDVIFDNSELFNGRIPTIMEECKIQLGSGTPREAANPYAQNEDCYWSNNTILSDKPVEFLFTYKNEYLQYKNNHTLNVKIKGTPFKR